MAEVSGRAIDIPVPDIDPSDLLIEPTTATGRGGERYQHRTTCPKCGFTHEAGSRYCSGCGMTADCRTEHIHRRCQRCDYAWYQLCVHQDPPAPSFMEGPGS